jgi:hypothetical protein
MPSTVQHRIASVIRWFPVLAFGVGLAGVVAAQSSGPALVGVAVMLVAMGLELAGWRRRAVQSPGSLTAAFLCGALCVSGVLAGIELIDAGSDPSTIARR